jgi:hypothetical protein
LDLPSPSWQTVNSTGARAEMPCCRITFCLA